MPLPEKPLPSGSGVVTLAITLARAQHLLCFRGATAKIANMNAKIVVTDQFVIDEARLAVQGSDTGSARFRAIRAIRAADPKFNLFDADRFAARHWIEITAPLEGA